MKIDMGYVKNMIIMNHIELIMYIPTYLRNYTKFMYKNCVLNLYMECSKATIISSCQKYVN